MVWFCRWAELLGRRIMVAIAQRLQRSATGVIYLQPKTASVSQNNTIVVTLFINSPKPITVVEMNVSYDSAKLELVGFDSSTSAFDSTIQEVDNAGTLTVARAKLQASGISGVLRVCSITFKALVANGSSSIIISSGNAAIDGTYANPALSGPAVITFTS